MRSFALAIATLLLLSSCTDDPGLIEPEPSASQPPTMSAQAKENNPEGVAAFVRHYVAVFNFASNTGRVRELSRLSDSTCGGCQSYIELFRTTYMNGGYFRDGEWKLSDYELEIKSASTIVFVHVSAPAGRTRETESAPESTTKPEDSELLFEVDTSSDRYRVIRFERTAG